MLYLTGLKVVLVLYTSLMCSAQVQKHSPTNAEELEGKLPEPRGYIPNTQYLDFVYHNHEELTKFLR